MKPFYRNCPGPFPSLIFGPGVPTDARGATSYSCKIELKDIVVKSEASEKFTNQKFLIKSGEKWFHISQDKECWIRIRKIKSNENKITLK